MDTQRLDEIEVRCGWSELRTFRYVPDDDFCTLVSLARKGLEAGAAPKRIEVDIGAAMQMLQASPELGQMMNEAVFGKVAADNLLAAEARITELESLLRDAGAALGGMLPENCGMADDPAGHHRPGFEKCERARDILAQIRSATE